VKRPTANHIFGTSHVISIDEAKHVYEKGVGKLIVGTGQYGQVELSEEAGEYFEKKKCEVKPAPTPKAIEVWNSIKGNVIGLFHVTC